MLEADESFHGREVSLPAGEVIEIRLPENPTTGYRWNLDSSGEPGLEAVGDAYEPPGATAPADGPRIVGRGGTHRWRLRAAHAGLARVELSYRRSWAAAGPAARTFVLQVRVPS